jgi:hypothetical protein
LREVEQRNATHAQSEQSGNSDGGASHVEALATGEAMTKEDDECGNYYRR